MLTLLAVQALSVTVAVLGNRKTHFKRLSLYLMIFNTKKVLFGTKKLTVVGLRL